MSRTITRIIYASLSLIFAVVIGYCVYMLVKVNGSSIMTASVVPASVTDGITAKGVIVRNEELIYKESGRYYVPLLETGERVSANKNIAAYFTTESNMRSYMELREKKLKIRQLEEIISSGDNYQNVAAYNDSLYARLREASALGLKGSAELSLEAAYGGLEKTILSRDYLLGEYGEIQSDLERQKSERDAIINAMNESERFLKTQKAGYFSLVPDGREETLPFGGITRLSPEEFSGIMDTQPSELGGTVLGKMIYGCDWYIVFILTGPEAKSLDMKAEYSIKIAGESLRTTVEAINYSQDAAGALVALKCSVALTDMASSRVQLCTIIQKTYEGFKIPLEALRVSEGKPGVYVLEGVMAVFKPVEILYTGTSFYVVRASSTDTKELFLYDEVILNRKDLYDGKIVG